MEGKIAIITARGGSKRIPRKNIREFCGKPIIAYSIEASLEAGIFDEVMVSTEDREIAEVAKQYGANIPFLRSAGTADDHATTTEVLLEVLEQYQILGKKYSCGCCIYPTAPFITGKKLRNAMQLLEENKVESVIPVTAFSFPPMRGVEIENGKVKYIFPEYSERRSQDIPMMYHDCGQFYCFKVDSFMNNRKLVTNYTKAIIMPELEVQDIDNEQDWKIAEMKYQFMKSYIKG